MFDSLSERLGGVLDKLTRQGALRDEDVSTALREVRTALLEADVSLPVARDFIEKVRVKAVGGKRSPSRSSPASKSSKSSMTSWSRCCAAAMIPRKWLAKAR